MRSDERRNEGADERVARIPLSRKIVYAVLPALALCALTEIVVRVLPNPHERGETLTGMVEPDADLIWRLKPFAEGPLKTNALGFRDDPPPKEPGVRILLVGDSVAWGDWIADRAAVFPQVAERQLQETLPGLGIEIVNAAVPGYSTFQERRFLDLRGAALNPRLLVLQFCLNDVVTPYIEISAYGGRDLFLGIDTRDAIPGAFGWMVRHSRAFEALARLAIRRARDWEQYDVEKLAADRLGPELEEAWRETVSQLDAIDGFARDQGITWLLLIPPYRFQLEDPAGLRQPQDRLVAWARERGVAVRDMLPDLAARAAGGAAWNLFRDESHFSESGHAMAGEILAEALSGLMKREGITGRSPAP